MSEMAMRVAKAIIEATNANDCDYLNMAKAAIAAMREPTEGMVSAVRRAKPYDMDITESWPIAIDEALK